MTEITDNIGESVIAHVWRRRRARAREDVAGRWAPPAAWVAMTLMVGPYGPAWVCMWLLAVAVLAACKWATGWRYRFARPIAPCAGFLLGYAGMDAEAFLLGPPAAAPRAGEWLETI